MSESAVDRETVHLIRDALALPDRQRLVVLQRLREDLAQVEPPSKIDDLNERMANAVEIFDQVAEHLGLDSDELKLTMTMREFDSAPSRVREGAKARHLAAAFLSSWPLAKQAAIGDRFAVTSAHYWERKRIARKQKTFARQMKGVADWLETEPTTVTKRAYDEWRDQRNRNLDPGERPFVKAQSVCVAWKRPWAEIVEAVKAGELSRLVATGDPEEEPVHGNSKPAGESDSDPVAESESRQAAKKGGKDRGQRKPAVGRGQLAAPEGLRLEPRLLARRITEARVKRGWTKTEAEEQTGVNHSIFSRLEKGTPREVSFDVIVRLARGLDVPIDYFVTDDGQTELPESRHHVRRTTARATPGTMLDRRKKGEVGARLSLEAEKEQAKDRS